MLRHAVEELITAAVINTLCGQDFEVEVGGEYLYGEVNGTFGKHGEVEITFEHKGIKYNALLTLKRDGIIEVAEEESWE